MDAAPDPAPNPAEPLVLTMGEPAGVGGELTLAAWAGRRENRLPPFCVIDDPARLAKLAAVLGRDVPVAEIGAPAEAVAKFATALPVLDIGQTIAGTAGRPDPADAAAVMDAIARAVELCQRGEAAGLVTNPINKKLLYDAGFRHPGHTEYLAALTGVARPVMLLACDALKVVPVTIHIALAKVVAALSTQAIFETAEITAAALCRDFAIPRPRLAVAGLNPHAGEDGGIGGEDAAVVAPAVARLQAAGHDVFGPVAADTLFHAEARKGYDAAICMYHDQANIPIKTIDFWGGVNVTLGLPVVRTSPDHGTAFDIAGSRRANPASLIAALRMAAAIAANRAAFDRAA